MNRRIVEALEPVTLVGGGEIPSGALEEALALAPVLGSLTTTVIERIARRAERVTVPPGTEHEVDPGYPSTAKAITMMARCRDLSPVVEIIAFPPL